MSKQSTNTTRSTSDVDPYTQQMRGDVYDAARTEAGFLPGGGMPAPQGFSEWMRGRPGGLGGFGGGGGMANNPLRDYQRYRAQFQANAQPQGSRVDPNFRPPGVGPLGEGAQDIYGSATDVGRRGLDAIGGDADAAQQFMNPYQQQVIDQMMAQLGHANALTSRGISDSATRSGAFGGSRHGVAEGVALAENQRNTAGQIAGLLHSGFEGAMGRAGAAGGLGLGAAGSIPGFNEYARTLNDPELYRMMTLQRGMQGMPYGQQGTNSVTTRRNPLAGALGGAISGFETFGPWGAVAGGIGGLL